MHNAADAGALAGGSWVKKDQLKARLLAQEYAAKNSADHNDVLLDLNLDNDPNGDIVVGRYTYDRDTGQSYFTPFDPCAVAIPVNALAVIVKRTQEHEDSYALGGPIGPIALNFGSLVGVDNADLAGNWVGRAGPYAIAKTGGGVGSGLICLRHDLTGLHVHGDSTLAVKNITDPYVFEDGAIQVNSSDDVLCVTTNGGPEIIADILNITASDCTQKGVFQFPEEPDMYVNFKEPPMPDPLIWMQDNPPAKGEDLGGIRIVTTGQIPTDTNGNIIPIPSGYYSDGLDLNSGTPENPILLGPGIYVLGGAGLSVGANATVVADSEGAFFFIADDGICNIDGGAEFTASPLKDTIYEGIIIAQDYQDLKVASIIGGPGFNLEGTMYFPQHVVDQKQKTDFALILGGTGAVFNNQIIADSVYVPGTSDVLVNYDGRNPAAVSRAYLVE
jgi:hypothetical protein